MGLLKTVGLRLDGGAICFIGAPLSIVIVWAGGVGLAAGAGASPNRRKP